MSSNTSSDEATPTPSQNKTVFVGNLSFQTSWQDLKDAMKETGHEVLRVDILTAPDGRSKGCGIVEFATAEGAQNAIQTLNNTQLGGREIFLREGEDRPAGSNRSRGQANRRRFTADETAQTRRVYVGNCAWNVTWQDLKDHMRQAGEVVHAEIFSEHNGRSKGCGIAEYATEAEAQNAIQTLNDTELNGRMIFVREDRENTNAAASGGGGSGSRGGGRQQNNTSVYVWGLDESTSWQQLKDHMRKAGNVDQVTIQTDAEGRSLGRGIVVYQKPHDAARAIRELEGSTIDGSQMHLREDRAQGRTSGGSGRKGRSYRNENSGSDDCQVYIANISDDTDWRDLKDLFRQCGDVDRADVKYSGRTSSLFGIVRYYNPADAQSAIEQLNGADLKGSTLEVRLDKR